MELPSAVDVVIVGAGPAGLATAILLASKNVPFVLLDALAVGQNQSRAAVVHAFTLEQLDTVGAADMLVQAGTKMTSFSAVDEHERPLASVSLDSALKRHTKFPFVLLIAQCEVERHLAARLAELGGSIHREKRVSSMETAEEGLSVSLESGEVIKTKFVVAADGSRSIIREAAGIQYLDPHTGKPSVASETDHQIVLGDLLLQQPLPAGAATDRLWGGFHPEGPTIMIPLPRGKQLTPAGTYLFRLAATVPEGNAPHQPDAAYFQSVLDRRGPGHATNSPAHIVEVLSSSRYRVRSGLADTYYKRMGGGWVLLVGDAAHCHSPMGGQGMNLGLTDGIQLGLAIVEGTEEAFKRYEKRRRVAAAEVINFAEALTSVAMSQWLRFPGITSLRNWFIWSVSRLPWTRNMAAWRLSGLVYRDLE